MKLNKYILIAFASIILATILWYTNLIAKDLQTEETKRMQLLAEATKMLASTEISESETIDLLLKIVQGNTTIPVVVTDNDDNIIMMRNIVGNDSTASEETKRQAAAYIIENGIRIDLNIDKGYQQHFYYSDSHTLRMLSYYPLIQIGLVTLFIIFGYTVIVRARRQEQDKVWIGLARETAHQLGTPITAIAGWTELLRTEELDNQTVATEIDKDNDRLKAIADRFSKIGSEPAMISEPIIDAINNTINYLATRIPSTVSIKLQNSCTDDTTTYHNKTLIEWTIENICRNAVDAMNGKGEIVITLKNDTENTIIDIADNGKGMTKSTARRIFKAGFTTKKRGWGIGLALAKRIVEKYHKGKIFVRSTAPGVGTTIRITLKRRD
ncbi:MAG: HAMP domain-containing histidine kinase [Bacteroidales bacterium]|nr:HAMP domain-containing histidine kinase [Bacteroidales bacterium]